MRYEYINKFKYYVLMNNFGKNFSLFTIITSVFLIIYILYRSQITYEGLNNSYYNKYYLTFTVGIEAADVICVLNTVRIIQCFLGDLIIISQAFGRFGIFFLKGKSN